MQTHTFDSFVNLFNNNNVPSYTKDPAFQGWYDSLPVNERRILSMPGRSLQSFLVPYYERQFNNFKIKSGLEAERQTQNNLSNQGFIFNSPFFPQGFNLREFMIGNPVSYNNNTTEAGQRSRFSFRSA